MLKGYAMLAIVVPALLIVLAIPMIFEKVPRNLIYGFRTRYTLSSDAVWYRANRISGIAILAACVLWLGLALVAAFVAPSVDAARWVNGIGLGSLFVAIAVSFWLVYRQRAG